MSTISAPAALLPADPQAADAAPLAGSRGSPAAAPHAGLAGMLPRASADLSLSAAASLIAAVLADADSDAAPVPAPAPLVMLAGVPVPALAQALGEAVATSGLFYESHLAAFAQGLLAREWLAREPQAAATAGQRRDSAEARDATARPDAATAAAPGADGAQARLHPGIAAHLLPIVREQLLLLGTGVFRWSGEAWPAVPMRWTIQRDAPSEDACVPEQSLRWSTTLTLELPALGLVEVGLVLQGANVLARVASGPGAAAPLRDDAERLRAGLARHGLAASVDVAAREVAP